MPDLRKACLYEKVRPFATPSNNTYTLRPELGVLNARMMTYPSGKVDDDSEVQFEKGEISKPVNCYSLLIC